MTKERVSWLVDKGVMEGWNSKEEAGEPVMDFQAASKMGKRRMPKGLSVRDGMPMSITDMMLVTMIKGGTRAEELYVPSKDPKIKAPLDDSDDDKRRKKLYEMGS